MRAGDNTLNLAYTGTDALTLPSGVTIRTSDGLDANLTLPVPGTMNSLSGSTLTTVLDTAGPVFSGGATSSDPIIRPIAKDSTAGTMVYDANATDRGRMADEGISYALVPDHARFSIAHMTGIVTTTMAESGVTTYTLTLTATDDLGNVSATQHLEFRVTDLPFVTIERVGTDTVNGTSGALTYTLVFSEDVTGFERSDITVTGGTLGAITPSPNSATTYTPSDIFTLLATPNTTNAGRLTITVVANAALAVSGTDRNSIEGASTPLDYDTLAETPTITTSDDDITAAEIRAGQVPVTGELESGATALLCVNPTNPIDATCTGGSTYPGTSGGSGGTTWRVALTRAEIRAITPGIVTMTAIATDVVGNIAVSAPYRISVEDEATASTASQVRLPGGLLGRVTPTADGDLRVTEAANTADAPSGIVFSLTADISVKTDADADVPSTVCLPTADVPGDNEPILFHFPDAATAWEEIGQDTATTPGFVCGEVTTFSPFAVGSTLPPPNFAASMFDQNQMYTVGMFVSVTLPTPTDGTGVLTYMLSPMASIPIGLTFDPATRTLAGTPTMTTEATTLIYTVTDSAFRPAMASLTFTVTVLPEAVTNSTTRLNEQILSRVSQAATAGMLAAVAERVESAASGGTAPAVQFGGQSSLRGLLTANGQAILEDNMEYDRLWHGASFALPLDASANDATGRSTGLALWGSSDYRSFGDDNDGIEWEGELTSVHLGVDGKISNSLLGGFALSWNSGNFDYTDSGGSLDNSGNVNNGDYQYNATSVHPYIGWLPRESLRVWVSAGIGSGEIEISRIMDDDSTADINQQSLAGGFANRILGDRARPGGLTSLDMKGDVMLVSVAVDENTDDNIAAQNIDTQRLRLLLSGEFQRDLPHAVLMPLLEVGVRYDGGAGATGAGIEVGGGVRYANVGGNFTISGKVRTLLAHEYDEWGADLNMRLSSQSGRGLQLSVRPLWGNTQSAAGQLWNDGASDMGGGGDTTLQHSVESEVGYGIESTMFDKAGVLVPYTGITAADGRANRLRLGGRFAGEDGFSLNLEGIRENTADSERHRVLLRGALAF